MQHNFLVDLDSLFDTRLSLAMLLDPVRVANIIGKPEHDKRLIDNIGYISNDILRAFYSVRNKTLLETAPPTSILPILKDIADEILMDVKLLPDYEPNVIYVNSYPYELQDIEKQYLAANIKKLLLHGNVELIHIKPSLLDPKWIYEKSIVALIMYDFLPWLDYHIATNGVVKYPLYNVMCLAPAIMYGNSKYKLDAATLTELQSTLSVLADIHFLPLVNFSCIDYNTYDPLNETNIHSIYPELYKRENRE